MRGRIRSIPDTRGELNSGNDCQQIDLGLVDIFQRFVGNEIRSINSQSGFTQGDSRIDDIRLFLEYDGSVKNVSHFFLKGSPGFQLSH